MNWDLIIVFLIIILAILIAIGIKFVLLLFVKKGINHISNKDK